MPPRCSGRITDRHYSAKLRSNLRSSSATDFPASSSQNSLSETPTPSAAVTPNPAAAASAASAVLPFESSENAATSDANASEKSRRERRKEARLAKNKKKFDSWMHHQQSSKLCKTSVDKNSENNTILDEDREVDIGNDGAPGISHSEMDIEFPEAEISEIQTEVPERRNKKKRKVKSRFSEYLEMEKGGCVVSMQEDLKWEKKLAKKLKVKSGRLGGVNDEIDLLLEGIPSVLDSIDGKDKNMSREDTDSCKDTKGNIGDLDESRNVNDSAVSLASSVSIDVVINEHGNIENLNMPKSSKKIKRRKTKFEEYLEIEELKGDVPSGKEDIALEKKLAKKLKVKKDALNGEDDQINMLLEGVPSILNCPEDSGSLGVGQMTNNSLDKESSRKKHKTKLAGGSQEDQNAIATASGLPEPLKSEATWNLVTSNASTAATALAGGMKYSLPQLRSQKQNESQEFIQTRKRIRGLLNRLSESNVESITAEISTIFHSVGRSIGSQVTGEEVLASCSGGPRGNEQYAATFAAFVAGMACSVGIDFGAKLLASLAKCFEIEYQEEDNLSLRNLTLLLSYLYMFGVCSSVLMYDFLITLSKRLTEVDVSTILTVLQTCGMKLRSDDPVGMKNFIDNVQQKVHEMKAASGTAQSNISGKRMEFMLDTICDIKNNKKKTKDETVQLTRIKKWLQKLRVEDILIRGVKWSKLLDPEKKGQWWLSGDVATETESVEEVASKIGREVTETQKMLELAASLRMNTDARRAIFCIIMSAEDYKDAFVKLIGLDLPGKQDREIMRVLIECCLQEKIFNQYYCVLAHELCSHDKNHKFTLQYCIWDHFKELESMPLMRSMHLSKFIANMISSFSLSLSILKVVDLGDPTQLTPKRVMHFRMLFDSIFQFPEKHLWNIFSRIAGNPEFELLRNGIIFFVNKYVTSGQSAHKERLAMVKKALNNVEGVLR